MHRVFMAISCILWVMSFGTLQSYLMGLIGETEYPSFSVETALSAIFMSALAIYEKCGKE